MIQGGAESPLYVALHRGSLAAAICQMTQHAMSSSIILALLELCMATRKADLTGNQPLHHMLHTNHYAIIMSPLHNYYQHNVTYGLTPLPDYISNFSVYMAVLQLLRKAPLEVRYTICQQVISILQLNPHHVVEIANSPGWESVFLWLLTPLNSEEEGGRRKFEESSLDVFADKQGSSTTYKMVRPRGDSKKEGVPPSSSSDGRKQSRNSEMKRTNWKGAVPEISVDEPTSDGRSRREGSQPSKSGLLSPKGEESSTMPFRTRTNAFNDPSTAGESPVRSVSVSYGPSEEDLMIKRRSLTYSSSWNMFAEEESEEIRRTFDVVTHTIGHILWQSVEHNRDKPPWKVRCDDGGLIMSLVKSCVSIWRCKILYSDVIIMRLTHTYS